MPTNWVLILVLVEDGLRAVEIITLERDGDDVLILVLVEDGLRVLLLWQQELYRNVLILVLVEDGLREQKMQCDDH